MSNKIMKLVAILLAVVLVVALSSTVFAVDLKDFDGIKDSSGAGTSITNIIGAMINIAQIIGTGVAIIMLIVIAIKYISAAPGDKADIKKHAIVYVVGAIVLFAASSILGIVKKFAGNIQANE